MLNGVGDSAFATLRLLQAMDPKGNSEPLPWHGMRQKMEDARHRWKHGKSMPSSLARVLSADGSCTCIILYFRLPFIVTKFMQISTRDLAYATPCL